MEQLKVGIGADTKDLERGLKDAEKALKAFSDKSKNIETQLKQNAIATSKLGAETSKLTQDFNKGTISENKYGREMLKLTEREKQLSNQSKTLRNDLSKLNASTKDLGTKGMGTLKKGAISGNSAMTAFSRTVQDAPFGIMGVSNNITNLTEQFGYLKNKTGSAKGALQAMLRDLKGFGGISLAISVATSLMLVFGDTLFKTKDKAKDLKEEQEKLTKALHDYEEQLDSVRKSQLIGGRASASELTNLNLLRIQTGDITKSIEHRKEALKELQKLYPSYFGHLSTDIKDNRELGFAFTRLVSKIEDHNKAKAAAGLIAKNQRKLTSLEIQRDQKLAELKELGTKKEEARTQSLKKSSAASEAYNKKQKEFQDVLDQINPLLAKNAELINIVRKAGGVVPLTFKVEDSESVKKKLKTIPLSVGADLVGFDEIISNYSDRIDNKGRALAMQFKESTKLELGAIDTTSTDLSFESLKLKLATFSTEVSNTISGSLTSTLSQIGTAFGEALTQGGNVLGALGETLIQGLAGFLGKMGELLIEYGTLAVIKGKLDLAIAAGGPAAIAAGVAAIAVGVALKAVSAGIGSFASSGGNDGTSASSTGSGYTAPKSYGGSASFSNSDRVIELRASGRELIGVIRSELRQNRSLGGGLGLST